MSDRHSSVNSMPLNATSQPHEVPVGAVVQLLQGVQRAQSQDGQEAWQTFHLDGDEADEYLTKTTSYPR